MANCQNKCFISLVLKALKIKRKFKLYAAEKEYAKAKNENADVNKCVCTKFSKLFNSVDRSSDRSVKRTGAFDRFLVEDSIENFILKSVFGFLGGILLTYICFMFLVFSLNFTLKRATYICMGLGIILSLGLAFSVKIRCTVFLCIPQLFSKRGRQALLAYAFILALSGPAKNTLHNVEVMSESLACAQEQLKQAENELIKCVHKPNAAAKKSIEKLLEKLHFAVKDFKNFILQLYKTCFDILETVLQAQKWLYSITLLCYKKMGKPAHHCLDLLSDSIQNCQSISSIDPWQAVCKIDPRTQESICSTSATAFCMRSDVQEYLPVLKLQKQLEAFKHRAMNILYVRMETHQTYSQSNRSYTYHEEYQGMATEIRQKTDQFLQYFDFMSVIFGIFILVLFVKVIIYRHKFLTEDHYDNRYITSDFVDIDNTRAEFQMETLLPLEPREKMQYIKVTSIRLVPCERVRLLSSFVFLIFATFKIIIHILTDSSLYWILSSVRRDERLLYMSTLREEEPSITVRVVGYGLVAALLRNVTRAVKRQSTTTRLDPTPCLPDPVPPDWNRYYQILALVIICWLLALCEPYGLRLRHTVMVTYHPDRARERAIWLYNRIISNRTSFVKISRREIRKKYKNVRREATFRYQFMKKTSSPKCFLCKNTINCVKNRVECPTAHCVGVYCDSCFAILKFCSICSDPADYGDLSDLSEEKDSSEEEEEEEECLSRGSRRGAQKAEKVESKEVEEESKKHLLNLKEQYLKFKKEREKWQKEVKPSTRYLIQPKLLIRAVKYCRNKIPGLRHLRNLSDEEESSDWDLGTEMSSRETKAVDLNHERRSAEECREEEEEEEKKKEKRERRERKERSREGASDKASSIKGQAKDSESEGKGGEQKKPEKEQKKVRLFKKISPVVEDQDVRGVCDVSCRIFEKEPETPKPDFLFRKRDPEDSKSGGLAAAKDSLERIQKRVKRKTEAIDTSRQCSVDDLLVTETKAKEQEAAPQPSTRGGKTIQTIVCPVEVDSRCSETEMRSKITFPFIDHINIHQFAVGEDVWGSAEPQKESLSEIGTLELPSEELEEGGVEKANVGSAGGCGRVSRPRFSPSSARVCFRKSESSESVNESVRLCVKDETLVSSTESDCQFYCQPYRSSNSSSERAENVVKRALGKTKFMLKTRKQPAFYSIETDSSNDKFLSVKTSRRVRRQSEKACRLAEESDILLNILTRYCHMPHSKTVDFLKAKLMQFFKTSLDDGKSSQEEESSDIDDLEFVPKTTLFVADEDYEKVSNRINFRKTKKEKNERDPRSSQFTRRVTSYFYRQIFAETSTDGD